VYSAQYDVYGALTSHPGSTSDEQGFAGEQTDPTGLQYLRARYYDPSTGRFLSRDPLGSHSYYYANDNPVSATDPTGLDTLLHNPCICGNDPNDPNTWQYTTDEAKCQCHASDHAAAMAAMASISGSTDNSVTSLAPLPGGQYLVVTIASSGGSPSNHHSVTVTIKLWDAPGLFVLTMLTVTANWDSNDTQVVSAQVDAHAHGALDGWQAGTITIAWHGTVPASSIEVSVKAHFWFAPGDILQSATFGLIQSKYDHHLWLTLILFEDGSSSAVGSWYGTIPGGAYTIPDNKP